MANFTTDMARIFLFLISLLCIHRPFAASGTPDTARAGFLTADVIQYEQGAGKGLWLQSRVYDRSLRLVSETDSHGLSLQLRYDSAGRLLERIVCDRPDAPTGRNICGNRYRMYYQQGLLQYEVREQPGAGGWTVADSLYYTYRFDTAGRVAEERLHSASEGLLWRCLSAYSGRVTAGQPAFYYDGQGQLKKPFIREERIYNDTGVLIYHNTYACDSLGRVLRAHETQPDQQLPTIYTYRYDSAGRILEEARYFATIKRMLYRIETLYNSTGLPAVIRRYGPGNKPEWEQRYRYR